MITLTTLIFPRPKNLLKWLWQTWNLISLENGKLAFPICLALSNLLVEISGDEGEGI
jgi:hypothetical protein